ncbi:MAG: dihydrolipoyl dehydrogenase [Desulfovibrio sp.]|nr:dihydrolipoyl dehydrogenase [Desulfovibrio sp.]
MRITVIGGGPGGYTAAFEAARRGCTVTLIEQKALGGTCLNHGCIPTKALRASADAMTLATRLTEYGITGCSAPAIDLNAVRERKERIISILQNGLEKTCAHLKVTLLQGTGRIVDAHTVSVQSEGKENHIVGDAVIIATGSHVQPLPGLSFDHTHILSSDDALELQRVPANIVIVGGGVIGCEMASIYRTFGSNVTIIEGLDALLPMPSVDQEVRTLLQKEMRKQKIRILTGKTLTDVRVENGIVQGTAIPSPFLPPSANAESTPVAADMVLVTVGRSPATRQLGLAEAGIAVNKRGWIIVDETLQTSVPGIYAVGDILGPEHVMLAHVAAWEGLRVVETLCTSPAPVRYDAMPSAIFTSPEIASVGLSEAQARDSGRNVVCGMVPMRVLGKAHAMGELPGFFKVVAETQSGRLLGVHIVGAHASDMVAEACLALTAGLNVQQLAQTVHAHPTLAEGLYEAARVACHAMEAASHP